MNSQHLNKNKLPETPGVYFFKVGKEILYIGKATSLKDRLKSYYGKDLIHTRGPLIVDMVFKSTKVDFIQTNSVLEALILENNLIKKHQPKYNTKEKDDKSYSYVVITKETYPRVLMVRGQEIKAGLPYAIRSQFGPYPNTSQLRASLSLIRKIFTYRDKCLPGQLKPCFNYQIGLCPGICVNRISVRNYQKIIKNIELFLSSKTSQLVKNLEKEMVKMAKEKKFEEARKIRDIIFSLGHIQDVALIQEEQNISLIDEQEKNLHIEAYDASHLAGSNNVGVMVVSHGGEFKKSAYRKFKINNSQGSDADALREILERRFKHTEWPRPDLLVVDGNIIQLNIAKNITSIPVVAVTKDDKHKAKALLGDAVFIQKYKKNILQINAEAHRFALAFHRQRRSVIL